MSLNKGTVAPRFILHWQAASDLDATAWLPPRRWSRQVIAAALSVPCARLDPGRTLELTLRLCSNDEIQMLNRDFRQQDKATNVLSFAAEALPAHYGRRDYLGDLVLAFPYLMDEAKAQGKRARDHWVHLLVHGVLHLLGYDHLSAQDAAQMEALEQQILAGLGVADPYREFLEVS